MRRPSARWRVEKVGAVWGVIPPGTRLPSHTYWDHWDAIRRAQQLAKERPNG